MFVMNPSEPFDEEEALYAKGNTFREHNELIK